MDDGQTDAAHRPDGTGAIAPASAERRNGRLMMLQGVLRRISNELCNEKLVMPFLYAALGGSVIVAGLLAPVVHLARLVAQTLGARVVALARRRKPVLVATLTMTGVIVLLLPLVAPVLPLVLLPVLFMAVAALWGILNGMGALVALDLMGRLMGTSRQMSVMFAITALSGAAVIAATLASQYAEGFRIEARPFDDHSHLVWTSALFMFASALAALGLREAEPAEAPPVDEPLGVYLAALAASSRDMLRHAWFRHFLRARILFLSVEFALPFFAVHAATYHARTAPGLTMMVIAVSLGMMIGGVVWPALGKRRSLQLVLFLGPLVSLAAAAIAAANHLDDAVPSPFLHALAIFFLSLASQATFDGSNTYVVRSAGDAERPYAVSMMNLAAGLGGLVLALGAGLVADGPGTFVALILMVVLNIAAALVARTLPDVMPADDTATIPTA